MIRLLVYIYFSILLTSSSFSQGAWDIDYIYSEQITKDLVGKKVRLDFRHGQEAAKQTNWIRSIISHQDTGSIVNESGRIELIEKRALYVDHGVVQEQILISKKDKEGKQTIIYDSEIVELVGQKIKLKFFTDKIDLSSFIIAWVDISQLDGLMTVMKQ